MNGLKYWDPSKSMFDEAVSIIQNDPTKLPEGETEVTQENYFRIASLERLGTEQSTQFQDVNSGQTGWNWAWTSKLNESGDPVGTDSNCSGKTNSSASYKTAVGVCFEYNSRADIPRTATYHSAIVSANLYYNFNAATAETGSYALTDTSAEDSLCPAGWELPRYPSTSIGKSWTNLLATSYGLHQDAQSALDARRQPFDFNGTGAYHAGYAGIIYSDVVLLHSSSANSNTQVLNLTINSARVLTTDNYSKASGLSVRCVKK